MAEVAIEGNQGTALDDANVEKVVVGTARESLFTDSRYIVSALAQEGDARGADVFINFDPHDSTGTGMTRSRVASAP